MTLSYTLQLLPLLFSCLMDAPLPNPSTLPRHQITGLGWVNYWKIGWNRFDLLLVASSLADLLVSLIGGAEVSALKIQKVMRLLRLARVVKLVRGAKVGAAGRWRNMMVWAGLSCCKMWIQQQQQPSLLVTQFAAPTLRQGIRSLFGTLIVSLPAFWNVGALLMLLFYIYAYVGGSVGWGWGSAASCWVCVMCISTTVDLSSLLPPPGTLILGHIKHNRGLNTHANFERFWMSLLTLLRVSTHARCHRCCSCCWALPALAWPTGCPCAVDISLRSAHRTRPGCHP
jgi:hypothetical protein